MTPPLQAAPLVLLLGQVPRLYLDANVLLPQYLRAVFLDLADAGVVRLHWGKEVLAEVRRNLLGPKFGITADSVRKLLAAMERAFPDALVQGGENFKAQFQGKIDPKEEDLLAILDNTGCGGFATVLGRAWGFEARR